MHRCDVCDWFVIFDSDRRWEAVNDTIENRMMESKQNGTGIM